MTNYNIEHAWRHQKVVYCPANGYDDYGNPKMDAVVEISLRN